MKLKYLSSIRTIYHLTFISRRKNLFAVIFIMYRIRTATTVSDSLIFYFEAFFYQLLYLILIVSKFCCSVVAQKYHWTNVLFVLIVCDQRGSECNWKIIIDISSDKQSVANYSFIIYILLPNKLLRRYVSKCLYFKQKVVFSHCTIRRYGEIQYVGICR